MPKLLSNFKVTVLPVPASCFNSFEEDMSIMLAKLIHNEIFCEERSEEKCLQHY